MGHQENMVHWFKLAGLRWAHRDFPQQAQGLHVWCFCRTPNCGTESVLDLFAGSRDSASCWVALPSISVSAFALSYIILSCWICLLSLTGLLFSEGRWMGSGSTGEGKWGRAWRSGRRKNCDREVLYERRMKNLFSIRQTDRQDYWFDMMVI